MPATLSYPGVYIEEISSGVHTIAGVATSITAFVGRTQRGPVNNPITINNFADFQRIFGGLWASSPLSFAVRDFYLNGGSQAIIVRLYAPFFADDAKQQKAIQDANSDALAAATSVSTATAGATTAGGAVLAANGALTTIQNATTSTAAAVAAAKEVAAAVHTEASRTPYISIIQQMDISGSPTTGYLTLHFGADDKGPIQLSDLTGSSPSPDTMLKNWLNGLSSMSSNSVVVTHIGTGSNLSFKFSFANVPSNQLAVTHDITFDGVVSMAPQPPDLASIIKAAADAVNPAVANAVAAVVNRARLSVGSTNILELEAANPGVWGNDLRARVDHDVMPGATSLFNLSVKDGGTSTVEVFRNVSVDPTNKRNITRVLEQDSKLVRTVGALPSLRPEFNGSSPLGLAPAGADPFDNTYSNKVGTADEASDGNDLAGADYTGSEADKTGLFALEKTDLFNILCVPPYAFGTDVDTPTWEAAAAYCERRRAFLVIDAPEGWLDKDDAKDATTGVASFSGIGTHRKNAALFFPRLRGPNPLRDNQMETFAPCGALAGIFARTDSQRGVWKAPAGLEATLTGVPQLTVSLTDAENGELNPLGVNCLRSMPAVGRVVWGSRTLEGDDRLASEWKYIPVRRTALFIEESLFRGTQWVVFEPNDEPLWAKIRLNVGAFMMRLFRQGAFQGGTPDKAFYVKCDEETTPQSDRDLGIVNIEVGFAPLKPAEFVVIKIQQMAGDLE